MIHHRAIARFRTTRRAVALLATAGLVVVGSAGLAAADQIYNNIDDTIDSSAESIAMSEGGTTIVTLYLKNANEDGKNGCNISQAPGSELVVSASSSDDTVASVEMADDTFTSCGDTAKITVSALTVGQTTVTLSQVSVVGSDGTYDYEPATFIVNVGEASTPNTAPVVTVLGFSDGDSFPKGSEPTATCSVVDAEDTGESAVPTVDTLELDADGLGTVTVTCEYTDGGGLSDSDSASYTIYDPSAPSISYTLNPTSPDGDHSWYHGDVTLTWTVSEPDSPSSLVKTGCVDQNITADQANTSYSCGATSSGGTAGPVSVSIKRDGHGPSVAYTSAAPSTVDAIGDTTDGMGLNNWWIVPVTATFTGTDNLSGFDALGTLTSTQTATSSGENNGATPVTVNSPAFTDWAGNTTAAGDASQSFNIDLTNPALSITGPASGATFDVCHIPSQPSFSATDGASGVDSAATGDSWTGPGGTGVGTWTYSAHATDNAGRATSETRTYTASYGGAFGGVLQPVNSDGSSRFKLGSTVPVKFKLLCGTTPVSGAVATLKVSQGDTAPDPGVDEAISTAASTTGNLFRYDATAGQYIFNLNTKTGYVNPDRTTTTFTPGTYTLAIGLDDHTFRNVKIQLVK